MAVFTGLSGLNMYVKHNEKSFSEIQAICYIESKDIKGNVVFNTINDKLDSFDIVIEGDNTHIVLKECRILNDPPFTTDLSYVFTAKTIE